MVMDYRSFEINLTCLEGMKVKCLSTMHVYAVVSITGNSSSKHQTMVGTYFCDNPMRVYLEESKLHQNQLVVTIQLRHRRLLTGDKPIVEVHIPVKKLFDNCDDYTRDQYGVHHVFTPSIKPKGYLYFSYKFGEKIAISVKDFDGVMASPAQCSWW
jgi:hypothetical protein